MKLDELMNYVGAEYKQKDGQGKALGCMLPVYLLYPDSPRFEWPDNSRLSEVMEDGFKKNCQQVSIREILPGDVILFKAPMGLVHPAVYLGDDQIIHCLSETGMETMRLSILSGRIKGVYRVA